MEIPILADITYIFATAAVSLAICSKLKVPEILGYLITGVLLGPNGFSVIHALHEVEMMAEIGVVLLLFAVGLEFSLSHLLALKKPALLGGGFQVTVTALVTGGVVYIMSHGNLSLAIITGMIVSLSSTAIVLKVLAGRGEMDSPHGRLSTAVLIFQDIAVIPMMLLIPVMAGTGDNVYIDLGVTGAKAVFIVAAIFIGARTLVPKVLYYVAASKNRELFLLVVVLIGLGTASLTYKAGLSLALGAFLAGIMVSESGYGQQALSSVIPFKDIFTGFFFVSIGMLIDFQIYADHPVLILSTAVLILFGKSVISALSILILKYPLKTAVVTGLALGQVGEFSFIMAKTGVSAGVLDSQHYKFAVAVIVLTMAAAPFAIKYGDMIAQLIVKLPMSERLREGAQSIFTRPSETFEDHIVIVGYGLAGRQLAASCRREGVRFIAIEMNPETVKKEHGKGTNIMYGDASSIEVLEHAQLNTARAIAITVPDPVAVRKIVETARAEHPYIHIVARTRYALELSPLKKLGANAVISEEIESANKLVSEVMGRFDTEGKQVAADSIAGVDVRKITVPVASKCSGKNLRTLDLRYKYGVTVLSVTRGGRIMSNPSCDFTIIERDELLVMGGTKEINKFGGLLKAQG
ncbi:sodium/hydrogen exchanger [Denitrovibrio acetiphilus DSM 12809]|uniref:Sodium/hydrogen exchanger n=1 Tax=Denitrovibrio acetiphilus (strain DSM 12809 / NBRC 114555 / N2460) TaxID=522772 RepID=D4H494_DENA2|nr:monovalent cation:proton antiporter family protein [Denitrovibrio acetiphilus]ADD69223.1 sodium/hydrogen exchanger [Denitrovibrio acetiphilus DSM 12809]